MSTGGPSLRLVVHDDETARSLRRFDEHRGGGVPVDFVVSEDAAGEAVVRIRRSAGDPPLGVVARTEAEAFAAVVAGADDACVMDDIDLPRYIAFLDRVELRARQRREAENRRAAAAHAEKLAALGTVVAGVAHEVNNPLSIVVLLVETIRGAVEPLLQGQDEIFRLAQRGTLATAEEVERLATLVQTGSRPSDVRSSFDDASNSLSTIQAIVRDLRIFARAQDDERDDAVFLPDLIDHVLRVAGAHLKTIATLERDYGADLPILRLPRSRIAQVLTNLLINAAHAIAETKRETHRVRISMRCDNEALAISVSDTGPGISPEIIERIFDPFFTTKGVEGSSGGTGLGLSISRSILQALGGDLVVESVHGQGATFIALIPIAERRVVGNPTKQTRNVVPVAPHRASVLVIDDDETLLRTFATALRGRFHVLLASEGQEAIDLIESGSKPDALLCDVSMPVVDGPHFYKWLLDNRPALVDHTVFMSANVDGEMASAFASSLGRPLLEKPMSRDQLISVLERATGAPR